MIKSEIFASALRDVCEVTGRGGARSGAGRKPSGDAPKVPYTIKIKPETRRRIDELKESGFSLGKCVDEMVAKM